MNTAARDVMHMPKAIRPPGFFKRILYWIMDWDDEATIEEGLRRLRTKRRFLQALTPEQMEHIRNYDGPEYLGAPITERELRRIVRRR